MYDFTQTYFKRFLSYNTEITDLPADDLFLSVVIPAFNEPYLLKSLQSLKNCLLTEKSVEVITVINSPENCPVEICETNYISYNDAILFSEKNSSARLRFHTIYVDNLPTKFAGVGLARKIGMDEALRRFGKLNRPEGIIAGFDADATVDKNYFIEIERYFTENPGKNACSIYFEHPVEGDEFDGDTYVRIINYELHLRYLNESLRFASFPHAYHTIGSSFAVRADVYAKQGGMNRKKAGEDFYFLQKVIPLGNYGEINTTRVIPSPRFSDRVPFGTGAAMKKMNDIGSFDFLTYDFEVFMILKKLFDSVNEIYKDFQAECYHLSVQQFLNENRFENDLSEIRRNSPDLNIFRKRFFDWFNAFRAIKFLNFVHTEYFERLPVKSQAIRLIKHYFSLDLNEYSEKEILLFLREKQKESLY